MGKLLKLGLSLGLPLATIVGVGIPTAVIHAKNVNIELENEAFDQDMQDSLLAELESGIWGDSDVTITNDPQDVEEGEAKPASYSVEFYDLEIGYWLQSTKSYSTAASDLNVTASDSDLLSQLGLEAYATDPNIMWEFEGKSSIIDNDLKAAEEKRASEATTEEGKKVDPKTYTFGSIIISATRVYEIFDENGKIISEYSKTIYIAVKFA